MPKTKPKQSEPLELEPGQVLPAVEMQKYELDWWNPTSFPMAMEMADMMAKSDLVPKDFKGKPANIVVAWQFGASLGLNILSSMQSIAVINGRPSVWGDAPLAICKAHHAWGDISEEFHGEEGADDFRAICVVQRQGQTECRRVFSVKDAKRAGLWGNNVWATYPKRMLQCRARSWALRDTFPDALQGMGIGEEERDKNITAETTVTTEPQGATATERLKNKLKPKPSNLVEAVEVEAANLEETQKQQAEAEAEYEGGPADGMGGEEPEVEAVKELAADAGLNIEVVKSVEDYIAEAKTSEDLKRLNEEVHKRLLAGDITNDRQMQLMSLLHDRSQEIAKGGRKGKKK